MKTRFFVTCLPLALLAACGGGESDTPDAEASAEATATPTGATASGDPVELRGDGIAVGSNAFLFNAGRAEVETAAAAAFGEEGLKGKNEECGAGPVEMVQYANGLTLNFQDGKFVGWLARPGSEDAPGSVATAGGVSPGDPAAEAEAMPGYEAMADSTLDGEFSTSDGIGGFTDETSGVVGLYAGTNCFFR